MSAFVGSVIFSEWNWLFL